MTGTLFIIAAASGTGKTSLAGALANSLPKMVVSISHTTRSPRSGEVKDQNYYFVSKEEFTSLIAQDAFLEYAKIYEDYYGTSRKMVVEALREGKDIILDIDWQGARSIRSQFPCQSIFLLPPSLDELKRRLSSRRRENNSIIEQRMQKAIFEIEHYKEFDYLVVNQNFDEALKELQSIVTAHRLTLRQQKDHCKKLINDLLLEGKNKI